MIGWMNGIELVDEELECLMEEGEVVEQLDG